MQHHKSGPVRRTACTVVNLSFGNINKATPDYNIRHLSLQLEIPYPGELTTDWEPGEQYKRAELEKGDAPYTLSLYRSPGRSRKRGTVRSVSASGF